MGMWGSGLRESIESDGWAMLSGTHPLQTENRLLKERLQREREKVEKLAAACSIRQGSNERLFAKCEQLSGEVEELRAERDYAREAAVHWRTKSGDYGSFRWEMPDA